MKEFDPNQTGSYRIEKIDQLSTLMADVRWLEHHYKVLETPFKHIYQNVAGERTELIVDHTTLTMLRGACSGIYAELRSDQVKEIEVFQCEK